MMEENEVKKVKDFVQELLEKMTIGFFAIEAKITVSGRVNSPRGINGELILPETPPVKNEKDSIALAITVEDPQMLIGQNGQTLFELTRLLKIMLNKKLQKDFYVDLDINDYKKKKVEYLEDLAVSVADQVASNKETKILPPMPSYERRIIHSILAQRPDVATQSQGEGAERCVVIKLK